MTRKVLVLEGGGMKAAYANGVLSAFEEAGHRPWDAVVGTSAGGALGAWYSAGQARYAEGTWRFGRDKRFLSYRRGLLGRGPLLDHEALLDIVYRREHPLDVAALRNAPWPVFVTVVETATGLMDYVDIRHTDDPIEWLKATGRLPFASNGPVRIGGREYLDGGVLDPVPVRYAVQVLGADEVTVVLNNAHPPRRPEPRIVVEVAARRYPRLREGIVHHHAIKVAAYAYAQDPPGDATVHIVRPSRPTGLGRFSRDLRALQAAIEQGREDGAAHAARVGTKEAAAARGGRDAAARAERAARRGPGARRRREV